MATHEMLVGSQSTIWDPKVGLWFHTWLGPDGTPGREACKAYKYNGEDFYSVEVWDEATGNVWYAPVEVNEPKPENPLANMTLNKAMNTSPADIKDYAFSVKKAKTALIHREEVHGRWYESGWMYFFWFLTAMCAFVWFAVMHAGTEVNDGTDLGRFVAYFGWLFVGWIPLACSVIGPLQKEGYKRLAAAYSITLTALVTVFLAKQSDRR